MVHSLSMHIMASCYKGVGETSPFTTCILYHTQAAGKYRQQGRNYVVEDGDIIFFKFNAGVGLTAKKK